MEQSRPVDVPEGWTLYRTGDGQQFFYHAATGLRQWDRPEPVLPPGWSQHRDENDRVYYFHLPSGRSQWEMPSLEPVGPAVPPPPMPPRPVNPAPAVNPAPVEIQPQPTPNPAQETTVSYPFSTISEHPGVLAQPAGGFYSTQSSDSMSRVTDPALYLQDQAGMAANAEREREARDKIARQMGIHPDHGAAAAIEIELSAKRLVNRDLRGVSDPRVCVEMLMPNATWELVGYTETIGNNLNPHWVKRIIVDYSFQHKQRLRFTVQDIDAKVKLNDRTTRVEFDFLGKYEEDLATLVVGKGGTFKLRPDPRWRTGALGGDLGTISIRIHQSVSQSEKTKVQAKIHGTRLPKVDFWGKSDPFFEMHLLLNDSDELPHSLLYKSEAIENSHEPAWKEFKFDVDTHGKKPYDVWVRIKVKDWNANAEDKYMGETTVRLSDLQTGNRFQLKKGPCQGKNSELKVERGVVLHVPSHIPYIQGGCELRFAVAVDFCESNGKSNLSSSLHFKPYPHRSQYGRAIESVVNVMNPYMGSQKLIDAFAFGAKDPRTGSIGGAFPLNLHEAARHNPKVCGLDNLLACYEHAAASLEFGRPKDYSSVVRTAMRASVDPQPPSQQNQHYTVLLVFTDGSYFRTPEDIEGTKLAVIEASRTSPVSIVFIGLPKPGDRELLPSTERMVTATGPVPRKTGAFVGPQFNELKVLDNDSGNLVSRNGDRPQRDMVDFVFYDDDMDPQALAAHVLKEVPRGMVEYFNSHRIYPNPRNIFAPSG